ncbi:MAG: hypothetical protein H0U19_15070 [Acidobacteria bacterium]|nr:hypothetical protein [Acidobacteriota bacterium]
MSDAGYKLWVNDESTVLVRLWHDGELEVAFRPDPGEVWGPPVLMRSEHV